MTETLFSFDPWWWVVGVEAPIIGALFAMVLRVRRDLSTLIAQTQATTERGDAGLREALGDFKLEVATHYASISYLKEVEGRLTAHLLRIEDKIAAAVGTHREDGR